MPLPEQSRAADLPIASEFAAPIPAMPSGGSLSGRDRREHERLARLAAPGSACEPRLGIRPPAARGRPFSHGNRPLRELKVGVREHEAHSGRPFAPLHRRGRAARVGAYPIETAARAEGE